MHVYWLIVSCVVASVLVILICGAIFAYQLVTRIYHSVHVVEPSQELKRNAANGQNIFFRHLPALKGKIAHIHIGDYPTPISTLKYQDPELDAEFTVLLKREDMACKRYGGNKVRTLEFHLACAKVICEERKGKLFSLGGPGSNQIVATSLFSEQEGVPFAAFPSSAEKSSLDNVMNLMSMLSFPGFTKPEWVVGYLRAMFDFSKILFFSNDIMSPPGGNNPTGAFGHVGAIFELLEQVEQGVCAMPKHIFLTLGSGCTSAGLLSGIALSLKLGLGNADALKRLKIHSVIIQHVAESNPWFVKWTIHKVARDTIKTIHELGGPDASKELESILPNLLLVCGHAGHYGSWTNEGLAAKTIVQQGTVSNDVYPWMCSCFTSKCFAAMLAFIREQYDLGDKEISKRIIFWCTKSIIQPKGDIKDGWERIQEFPEQARQWVEQGHIHNQADFDQLMKTRFTATR